MVKDIDPGSDRLRPADLTNVNGKLYFTANDGVHGVELWKSDGTAAGTVMVKDIVPGAVSSGPSDLVAVNGAVEFYACDGRAQGCSGQTGPPPVRSSSPRTYKIRHRSA